MIHTNQKDSSGEAAKVSEASALGTNAKSSTPPFTEKLAGTPVSQGLDRTTRYQLLSQARSIYYQAGKDAGLAYPRNFHKTGQCVHTRLSDQVAVHQSIEHRKAFFSGVVICGKVFTCPVCAAKVQERRRLEIAQGFDWAYNNGHKVIMVTITFPHQRTDNLHSLLKLQSAALRSFREGNVWQKKKKRVGFEGMIRSLEVTHSDRNGWHPHTHEAWIVDPSVNAKAFRDWLANRWKNVCLKQGLIDTSYQKIDDFLKHSIQVTDRASNSDYLAKMDSSQNWGADAELSKASNKTQSGTRHPFAFLRDSIEGSVRAGRLWLEYSEAIKGKSQIFWTKGLKDRVGLNDLTDEELAKQQEDKADLLGRLSAEEWNWIAKNDRQAMVLSYAEQGDMEDLFLWLSTQINQGVKETTPTDSENRAKMKAIKKARDMYVKSTRFYTPVWDFTTKPNAFTPLDPQTRIKQGWQIKARPIECPAILLFPRLVPQ